MNKFNIHFYKSLDIAGELCRNVVVNNQKQYLLNTQYKYQKKKYFINKLRSQES